MLTGSWLMFGRESHKLAWFLILIIASCVAVGVAICYLLCMRRATPFNPPIMHAQKSYIITKKKIVLESYEDSGNLDGNGNAFSSGKDIDFLGSMLAPLVKINCEQIQVNMDMTLTSGSGGGATDGSGSAGGVDYELPKDEKWEIQRDSLQLGALLGKGEFGQVVQGEWLQSGGNGTVASTGQEVQKTIVAVKMLKEGHSDDEILDLVSEMEVMKRIGKHKNIINLLGCCTQNGKSKSSRILETD